MRILVFRLDAEDAILARLRSMHPEIGFRKCRAADSLDGHGRDLVALDTVPGLKKVLLIESLQSGWLREPTPALYTLRVLKKLGSVSSVRVISVPERYPEESAVKEISRMISQLGRS